MKRSFNYTERVKITQRAVSARLYNDAHGVQVFDADIDLSGYEHLPTGTNIYIEAYYRNALMRFQLGAYNPAQAHYMLRGMRLSELQDPIVNFRVKLVDMSEKIGRLIGVIERIQVFNENTKQAARIGLLPVNFGVDLGHRIWEVEFSDSGDDPMLCINRNLNVEDTTLRDFVARAPAFVTLVFPQALRLILERVVQEGADLTDEDSWQAKWTRFATSFGAGLPPESNDEEETHHWVDQVIEAFCIHTNIKTRFEDYLGEEQT